MIALYIEPKSGNKSYSQINFFQVAAQETYSIKVAGDVFPVETDLGFSKFGKVFSIATIKLENQTYSETGETVDDAVNNLAALINRGEDEHSTKLLL